MKKIALISGLMAVLLAGCGNHDQQQAQVIQPQPQVIQPQVAQAPVYQQDQQPQVQQAPVIVQQQPTPVIIQQAPQVVHDNSGSAMVAGMALGMMAAGGGGRDVHHYHTVQAPTPVVINKTYVNKTVVQAAPQPQTVINKTTVVNNRTYAPPVISRPSYSATSSNSSYKSVRTVTTTRR
jgi:outer membrane lipoprotein SlyB